MSRLLPAVLCWLFLAVGAMAQGFSLPQNLSRPMDAKDAFQMQLEPNDAGATLRWRIAPGYYLYRDHFQAETPSGEILELNTSPGTVKEDPTFGTTEVYFEEALADLRGTGEITITYQGCQEGGICYPPVQETVTLANATPEPALQLAEAPGVVETLSQSGGAAWVLIGFFGFGLLLAFTPCVFPMVPILAGMLARQGGQLSMQRGVMLSATYVVAMAFAFGLMGAVAGWSGQNLQIILQSPWAVGAVALLFLGLALSSFGMFELTLPAAATNWLGRFGGRGGSVGNALILGFTSALIVGPCVTAPLAGALLYIAQTGDVVLGAAALFALGLGQGMPLLLVGAFGSRILPKAGPWMEVVRRVFGIAFLAMAVWLAARVFPGPAALVLWSMLLIGIGVSLGALDRPRRAAGNAARMSRTAGVIVLVWGGILAVGAAAGGSDPLRPLLGFQGQPASDETEIARIVDAAELRDIKGPAMLYVTAEWCVYCRVIESKILPDTDVQAALNGIDVYKIDVTELDARAQEVLDTLGAAGPPTMVFLDASRQEPEGSRLIGNVSAEDLIRSAQLIGGNT